MRKILTFLSLLLSVLTFAQDGNVTGTVTDAQGGPLPGVNVLIKGTTTGTQTDFDGLYSIPASIGQTISFSYIGFVPQSFTYSGQATLDVALETDQNELDEVVVVGYGTKKRSDLTTAVSSVSSEDLTAAPAPSVNEALEGRASGVQVRSSGSPGEDSNVVIRGLNTFGNGTPLYVVDGVFVQSLNQINPASIASVDVLKDAAATAIYGSRGSNGIVIITTKKGKEGKAKFTFSTYTGFQKLPSNRDFNFLSGPELAGFLSTVDTDTSTDGLQISPRLLDPEFEAAETVWRDELYRTAPITNFNLGVSGGSEIAKYNLQAGIYDQEGVQLDTQFKRYTFNTNTEVNLSDKFKIGQTLNVGLSKTTVPEVFQGANLQVWANTVPQYLPVRRDGRFVAADRNIDAVTGVTINPVFIEELNDNEETKTTILGSLYGQYEILPGLTNKLQVGVDQFISKFNSIDKSFGSDELEGDTAVPNKTLTKNRDFRLTTTLTNILSYNKTFGDKHTIDLSAIYERVDTDFEFVDVTDNSETSNDIEELQIANLTSVVTSSFQPIKLFSYVANGSYSFANRYFLSGSIRQDKASNLGNDKSGIFSAASAAWIVSNEAFLSNSDVLTNFKLRAGYGETGNNNVPPFTAQAVLLSQFPVVFDNNLVPGIGAFGRVNPDLRWERSRKTNFGVDLGFWNNQVMFSGDYFESRSTDLLVTSNPARSQGLPPQLINSADVTSKGYEMTLGYNDTKGDFQWGFWGSFSTVDISVDKVDGFGGAINRVSSNAFGDGNSAILNIIKKGEPLYGLIGFETQGIFTDLEDLVTSPSQQQNFLEIDAAGNLTTNTVIRTRNQDGSFSFTRGTDGTDVEVSNVGVSNSGTALGDIKFVDQNDDGVIDANDETTIGDPNPDFTYSFTLRASYKGFDASVLVSGVEGVDVINVVSVPGKAFSGVRNFDQSILNAYSPTNTDTNVPRYTLTDPNANIRPSDRVIEDGSYTRVKNITLGYSLSEKLTKGFFGGSLSKLRVYLSAQNLITLTDYSGLDPEIRPTYDSSGIIGLGIDQGFSPTPATILGGIEIEF